MSYNSSLSIKNIDSVYNPTLPKDVKKPENNPFIAFIKKIWSAVKGVFKKIGDFFSNLFGGNKPSLKLNASEVNIIQNAQDYKTKPPKLRKPESPALSKKNVTQLDALLDPEYTSSSKLKKMQNQDFKLNIEMDIEKYKSEMLKKKEEKAVQKKKKQELPPIKDPVMKEFHDTSQKLIETVLESVFEKKVEPALTDVKEGLGKLSEGLKFGADLAIKVGDKAAKPLFEKLKGFSVEEKLKPDFQSLLKWLLKNGVKQNFKEKLNEALAKEFDDTTTLHAFTEPCVKWLLQTDHSQPLMSEYTKAGIPLEGNKDSIDKVFETAMLILLDHKIEKHIHACQEKLDGKLPDIMHKMIVENGRNISSILIRRLIEVIENAEYSKTFNTLIGVGLDQTEAIIAVEKAKENEIKKQKALIEKAEKAKSLNPKTAEEKRNKFELLMFLRDVEKIGVEKWINMKAEEAGLEAYTKLDICHPKIAELMKNPHMSKQEKEKIAAELFEELADQIIPILLPKQKVKLPSGKVEEVDGLVYLINQIEVPEEFKELAQEAVEISKEILTPETQKVIKGIYDNLWDIAGDKIQDIVVTEVKKTLKQGIKTGASKLFEQFITPNLINEMSGTHFLPAVQEQLLRAMAYESISSHKSKFADLFHNLVSIEEKDVEKRSEAQDLVCQEAYNLISNEVKQFKAEFDEIKYESIKEAILPEIEAIEDGIRKFQEMKKNTSKESVKVALDGYFTDVYNGSNPLFGELGVNLAFKIGNLSSTAEFFSDWIKGMISEQLTNSTHKMQKSPHYLMKQATEQIQNHLLDKEKISELLFGEKKEISEEEINKKLQEEITKTAKIAHDLIFYKVSNASGAWYKKPIVSNVLGSNHKHLAKVVSDIYHKVLGNRLMTHNLIVRGQEVVMEAIANSSRRVDQKNSLHPKKVDKMPSIIPDLFVA